MPTLRLDSEYIIYLHISTFFASKKTARPSRPDVLRRRQIFVVTMRRFPSTENEREGLFEETADEKGRPAKCVQFTCMTPKLHGLQSYWAKFAVETINLILSFYFFIMLSKCKHVHVKSRTRNHVVKITLILEIVFNILPTITGTIFNTIVGKSLGTYIGSYVNMTFLIHAAICSILYTTIFLSKAVKPSIIFVKSSHLQTSTSY
ncbi:hypothetical protein Ddc_01502 [Ditylenchus destructor]|nr:hypothetical protein Ddc_01502 [Ditylenchus destructor]